jgi:perosamine synthetase
MNELQAALGIVQMERLEEILEKRQKIAKMYNKRLKEIDGIIIPYIDTKVTKMSWFVYVIRLNNYIDRNKVLKYLSNNNIGCKPYFSPIHLQPYMKKIFGFKQNDFPITEKVSNSTIALPFHNNLTIDEINYIAEKLEKAINIS